MKILIFLVLFFSTLSFGQISEEKLAEELENPISFLMRIPIQDNYEFSIGPYDRAQNELSLQPVIPFHLTSSWNLITHTFFPLIWMPDIYAPSGTYFGLSNIELDLYFSPTGQSNFIWGLGPLILFPTSTNYNVAPKETALGAGATLVWTPQNWVLGFQVKQLWSVGGPETSTMDIYYFINFNFPYGYYLTTSPTITSNWEEKEWIVPFGFGGGKVFEFDKQYLNVSLQAYYNVVSPSSASEWTIRGQISFLFPK